MFEKFIIFILKAFLFIIGIGFFVGGFVLLKDAMSNQTGLEMAVITFSLLSVSLLCFIGLTKL